MSPDRASTSLLSTARADRRHGPPARSPASAATRAAADSPRCSRSTAGPSRSSPRTSAAWSAAIRSTLQSGSSWARNSCSSPLSAACAASMRGLSGGARRSRRASSACASLIGPQRAAPQAASSAPAPRARTPAAGRGGARARAAPPRPRAPCAARRAARSPRRQPRHARAAVGLDPDEPLGGERPQRRAQRVPGDAVARGQLLLDQPLPAGALAFEDLLAQRCGDGLDGAHAGTVAGRRRTSGAASTSSPPRISARAERRGRRHPLAEHDHAQQRRRQRLGERQRRGLGRAEAARPRANST